MERKRNDGNEQAREADEQNEAETLIDAQFEFGPCLPLVNCSFDLGRSISLASHRKRADVSLAQQQNSVSVIGI